MIINFSFIPDANSPIFAPAGTRHDFKCSIIFSGELRQFFGNEQQLSYFCSYNL